MEYLGKGSEKGFENIRIKVEWGDNTPVDHTGPPYWRKRGKEMRMMA